jgi:hypothetical protein
MGLPPVWVWGDRGSRELCSLSWRNSWPSVEGTEMRSSLATRVRRAPSSLVGIGAGGEEEPGKARCRRDTIISWTLLRRSFLYPWQTCKRSSYHTHIDTELRIQGHSFSGSHTGPTVLQCLILAFVVVCFVLPVSSSLCILFWAVSIHLFSNSLLSCVPCPEEPVKESSFLFGVFGILLKVVHDLLG